MSTPQKQFHAIILYRSASHKLNAQNVCPLPSAYVVKVIAHYIHGAHLWIDRLFVSTTHSVCCLPSTFLPNTASKV